MTELKPCPFCGGEARLKNETADLKIIKSYVECSKCLARTYSYRVSAEYSSNEKAIEDWNKRTGEQKDDFTFDGGITASLLDFINDYRCRLNRKMCREPDQFCPNGEKKVKNVSPSKVGEDLGKRYAENFVKGLNEGEENRE